MDLYKQTAEEFQSVDDFSDEVETKDFNNSLIRAAYYAKSINKAIEQLKKNVGIDNVEITKQLDVLEKENEELLKYLKDNRQEVKEAYIKEVHPLAQIQKQKSSLLNNITKEQDKAEKTKLIQELEELQYLEEEYRNIEGVEQLQYTQEELEDVMRKVYISKSMGSKQNPASVSSELPLKDKAA